jgi:hypothetical protein
VLCVWDHRHAPPHTANWLRWGIADIFAKASLELQNFHLQGKPLCTASSGLFLNIALHSFILEKEEILESSEVH